MSGPGLNETVYNRDSQTIERRHICNLRLLADRVEEDTGYFAMETRDGYPELTETSQRAIAAYLRAKADKLEAHMDAMDTILFNDFSTLVKTVEWASTGDYGPGKVAEAWEEYDG